MACDMNVTGSWVMSHTMGIIWKYFSGTITGCDWWHVTWCDRVICYVTYKVSFESIFWVQSQVVTYTVTDGMWHDVTGLWVMSHTMGIIWKHFLSTITGCDRLWHDVTGHVTHKIGIKIGIIQKYFLWLMACDMMWQGHAKKGVSSESIFLNTINVHDWQWHWWHVTCVTGSSHTKWVLFESIFEHNQRVWCHMWYGYLLKAFECR
jgi:hypothetical protein